jgi:arylsulfatase A-like enzyme
VENRTEAARPNILLVVMDCVRADTFDDAVGKGDTMPFCKGLIPEVARYTATVAPSTWTIPSHASLFTGVYPWSHGAHYQSGPTLGPRLPTLAEVARGAGYATAAFSANPLVQPATGLTRGFEHILWGGYGEFLLRFLPWSSPSLPGLSPGRAAADSAAPGVAPGGLGLRRWFKRSVSGLLTGVPPAWDALNRAGRVALRQPDDWLSQVSPWIEPSFDDWLEGVPSTRPTFTFVNLFEAHEPYLAGAGFAVDGRTWLKAAASPQSERRWLTGHWSPKPADLQEIRLMYSRTLCALDKRVEALVSVLKRHHRWDGAMLVLTSDHGQEFMEEGSLYHRFSLDNPIVRVPLWVRYSGGEAAGLTSASWTTLLDVPRTIGRTIGGVAFGDSCARPLPLTNAVDSRRIVLSMADGLAAHDLSRVPSVRRRELNRVGIAAFAGDVRAVAYVGSPPELKDAGRPDKAPRQHGPDSRWKESAIRQAVNEALAQVEAALRERNPDASVSRHLEEWGY